MQENCYQHLIFQERYLNLRTGHDTIQLWQQFNYIWDNLITWAFRASTQQPTQPEYNRPLVFLHNLNNKGGIITKCRQLQQWFYYVKHYGNVYIDNEGRWRTRMPLESVQWLGTTKSFVVSGTFNVYEQNGKCFYRKFQGIFKILRKLANA